MCVAKTGWGIFFGLADGAISTSKELHNKFSNSIESISANDDIVIACLEGGDLIAYTDPTQQKWLEGGFPISCQSIGFRIPYYTTHWSTRWSGIEGSLQVRNLSDGTIIAQSPILQTRCMASSESRVVIGSEDGNLHVWQNEMFERRSNTVNDEDSQESGEKSALKERLRALRNK